MSQVQNLITEHLDTWTQAIETKSSAGRGSSNKFTLVGIKKLRELILEMAIRGLLVPQDSNDEPASVLLERIAAEKAHLIKEGKIKKTKALPKLSEDEKPFELPNGWEIRKLGDLVTIIRGVTYKKNDVIDEERPDFISLMRANNINSGLNFDNLVYIPRDLVKPEQVIRRGDTLIAMSSGSANLVGKAGQANKDIDSSFGAFCAVIRSHSGLLFDYLRFFFQTPLYRLQTSSAGKGIGINNLTTTALNNIIIPIPTGNEQKRIVAKVDELMALCDQLEQQTLNSIEAHQTLVETLLNELVNPNNTANIYQAWSLIAENFDVLFTTEKSIDTLKQTILQLAVMGKLVPQNPNDEPASKLLEKIATEKAQLIKDKKIKKTKPLPEITEDEKPFDLPIGWEWVRLGEQCVIRGGKRVSNGYKLLKKPTPYIYIRVSDMKNGTIDDGDLHYIDEGMREKISQYIITKNDLYMTIVGATIGKCGSVPLKFDQMNLTENAARLTPILGDSRLYILKMLESEFCQNQFFDKTKQVGVQKMALIRLSSTLLPLPPLKEQTRIVTKVNELMTLCDQLKTQLQDAKQTQTHLAQSIAQEALG